MNKINIREVVSSFSKYLVAGGVGFVCDYSSLFVLYHYLGLHYLFASACAFVAGVLVVYIASNVWVFKSRKMEDNKWLEFLIFLLIGIVGLGLTILFMWCFVDCLGLHLMIAKLITAALVLVWNYAGRKIILY